MIIFSLFAVNKAISNVLFDAPWCVVPIYVSTVMYRSVLTDNVEQCLYVIPNSGAFFCNFCGLSINGTHVQGAKCHGDVYSNVFVLFSKTVSEHTTIMLTTVPLIYRDICEFHIWRAKILIYLTKH